MKGAIVLAATLAVATVSANTVVKPASGSQRTNTEGIVWARDNAKAVEARSVDEEHAVQKRFIWFAAGLLARMGVRAIASHGIQALRDRKKGKGKRDVAGNGYEMVDVASLPEDAEVAVPAQVADQLMQHIQRRSNNGYNMVEVANLKPNQAVAVPDEVATRLLEKMGAKVQARDLAEGDEADFAEDEAAALDEDVVAYYLGRRAEPELLDDAEGEADFTKLAQRALEEADFDGADFDEADFDEADFDEADFENADFEEADFEEADADEADFEDADFEEADADEADFEEADTEDADFEEADTEDAGAEASWKRSRIARGVEA